MPIKVGIVGARGLSTIMGFKAQPDVEVTALCDLNESLLKERAEKHNIPKTYRIFEDMLDSDIDAVVIATPMQCHVPQAMLALEAGKHVMSEVTAGVTMDELWWLIECVEKYNRVYMFAENYCYTPPVQCVKNMVEKGVFGEVYFGEGEYLHDVKSLTQYPDAKHWYSAGRTSWRKYWQLGKRGAFYPTHSLGPVMQWFGDDHIKSIICTGTGWHTSDDLRQEDTSITLCQMESGKLIKLRVDCVSNRPHCMSYYSLQGTKAAFEAPRAKAMGESHKIWIKDLEENQEKPSWRLLEDFYEQYLPDRYKNSTEEQKKAGHGGGDFYITSDFIDAIKNGTKPAIDVYQACEWTAVGLLSELSVMNGGRIMEMPKFRKNMERKDQIIKL